MDGKEIPTSEKELREIMWNLWMWEKDNSNLTREEREEEAKKSLKEFQNDFRRMIENLNIPKGFSDDEKIYKKILDFCGDLGRIVDNDNDTKDGLRNEEFRKAILEKLQEIANWLREEIEKFTKENPTFEG